MQRTLILAALMATFIPVCDVAAQIPPIERGALIALYDATNGPSWTNNSGWATVMVDPECSWYGVTCFEGHVTHLDLSSNQLNGVIPPELKNLSNLANLHLWSNQLSGSIPPNLGSLSSLSVLDLAFNQLSGNIPPELGSLSSLTDLFLDGNQLTGSIPTELGSLSSLDSSSTNIGYNALWTDDRTLQAFLDTKDPDWDQTQTIAPTDVSAGLVTSTSFVVSWTPIPYTADNGWYLITNPTSGIFSDGFESGDTTVWGAGGPTPIPADFMTVDKTDNSILIDGLQPGTQYQFVVRTITEPHAKNQNQLITPDEESAPILLNTP